MRYSDVKEAYDLWLRGWTLRQLGHRYGLDHTWVRKCLIKQYGRDAVNPVANSLARSLLSDYPDCPTVTTWLSDRDGIRDRSSYYRSNHNLRQLSRYTVIHDPELLDVIAVAPVQPDYDSTEDLRLPMLVTVLTAVTELLHSAITCATVET